MLLSTLRRFFARTRSGAEGYEQADTRFINELLLLRAVNKAQRQCIGRYDPAPLFNGLLESLLELTSSEYGFIGDVLHTADGAPYLKTRAITNIAWNSQSRDFYQKNVPQGLEFFNMETLFGAAITSEAAVVSNDPQSDSRGGGLPPGHPAIRCFLGLPFHLEKEMMGMVGIANRPGGYSEQFSAELAPFLDVCGQLTHHYRLIETHNQLERAAAKAKS